MKATIASFVLLVMLCGEAIGQEGPPSFPAPDQSPPPPMMNQPGGAPPRVGPMGPMGPGMQREWWKDQALVQKLQISDDQVQKIEKIAQDYRTREIDLRAAAQKQEVALRPMMESDQPDESQILAQIDKVAQARADLEKSRVQMDLAVRRVLTAEQAQKLRDLRPRFAPPRPGFGRPDGGPGGPSSGPPALPPNGSTN